jgi:hypothetical protein
MRSPLTRTRRKIQSGNVKAGPAKRDRPFCFQFSVRLTCDRYELVSEHSLEALLFILIVQHHDGNDAHRALAVPADGHFTLQVLQESVGEAVQRPLPAGILRPLRAAVRAGEFNDIFLWIAVQRGPPGLADSESLSRLAVHDTGTYPFRDLGTSPKYSDAQDGGLDATSGRKTCPNQR